MTILLALQPRTYTYAMTGGGTAAGFAAIQAHFTIPVANAVPTTWGTAFWSNRANLVNFDASKVNDLDANVECFRVRTAGSPHGTGELLFDAGAGKAYAVKQFSLTGISSVTSGTTVQLAWSDDDSTYTNVVNGTRSMGGTDFDGAPKLSGAFPVAGAAAPGGHRYWRLTFPVNGGPTGNQVYSDVQLIMQEGGLAQNGTAAREVHWAVSGTGGGTASGAATVVVRFAVAGTGGGTSSGTAAFQVIDAYAGTGGGTGSGSVGVQITVPVMGQGGGVSSGVGALELIINFVGSGGGTGSGAATTQFIPNGGVTYTYTMSGGGTSSGTAALQFHARVAGTGGGSSAGTAGVALTHGYAGTGGGSGSGSVGVQVTVPVSGSGGGVSSGVGALAFRAVFTPSGGGAASGEAGVIFRRVFVYSMSGGGTGGGAAGVAVRFAVAGTGGGTSSGTTIGSAGSYKTSILALTPAAYWRLDEVVGSAVDVTGNGHDGAYTGTGLTRGVTGLVPSDGDQALAIDGTAGSFVLVPDDPGIDAPTGSFTIVAWVRPTTVGAGHRQGMFDRGTFPQPYNLFIDATGGPANGKVVFDVGDGVSHRALTSNQVLAGGQAYMIVASYEDTGGGFSREKIIINGMVDLDAPGLVTIPLAGGTALRLGRVDFDGSSLDGVLDECVVLDGVFSDATWASVYEGALRGLQFHADYQITGGGGTGSGQAGVALTHAYVMSGGGTGGGHAAEAFAHAFAGSGGGTAGGTATIALGHVYVMSGGGTASGEAVLQVRFVITAEGGGFSSGAARTVFNVTNHFQVFRRAELTLNVRRLAGLHQPDDQVASL